MSEELLIRQCSPTLAGIKTANLFTCRYNSKSEMNSAVRLANRKFREKGLVILPLKYKDGLGLIYVFRPKLLKSDIRNKTARNILDSCGYCDTCDANKCIIHLMKRLSENDVFPHEIGLFLGYPPEDVKGFIDNKAKNFKAVGYWKVYGDKDKAEATFKKYKKCTDVYYHQWRNGKLIERLTVAV